MKCMVRTTCAVCMLCALAGCEEGRVYALADATACKIDFALYDAVKAVGGGSPKVDAIRATDIAPCLALRIGLQHRQQACLAGHLGSCN